MTFDEKYTELLEELGEGRPMVLSTCENGAVSSRMMSVIRNGGTFFFQTDCKFRKYRQLLSGIAALCADNISLEGKVSMLGHPKEAPLFCRLFEKRFKGSFDAYTFLEDERLFAFEPVYAERWVYLGGEPYLETFDIPAKEYRCVMNEHN